MISADLNLLILIQQLPQALLPFMKAVSFLGTQPVLLCVAIFFMYCVDYKFGAELILLLGFSTLINSILKTSLRIQRPYEMHSGIKAYNYNSTFNGYAMPSLHTQSVTVIFGKTVSHWSVINIFIMIISLSLISVSRVYLGMHKPGQTLAGILVGVIVLYLFKKMKQSSYIKALLVLPEKRLFLFIVAISLAITLCSVINIIIFGDLVYNDYLTSYTKMENLFFGAGLFAGVAVGSTRFLRRFSIKDDTHTFHRYLRFFTASFMSALLLVPVRFSMNYIAATAVTSTVSFFGTIYFTYLLYTVYGYLLTFIFPVIFHKMKILRLHFNYLS